MTPSLTCDELKELQPCTDSLTDEDHIAMAIDAAAERCSGKLDDNDICPNCHRDYSRWIGVPVFCPTCHGGF